MAQSLRRFAGLAIVLMLHLLPSLISPPRSLAQVQAGDQTTEELIVHPDGIVHVDKLPPLAPETPVDQAVPRKFPHPEVLRQKKEEFRQQRLKTQPTPESALRFETPLSASLLTASPGFIGLRRSESGGFIPPDTQVAAGPSHLFEVVNTEGRIFTKNGDIISTFNLNAFFGLPRSTFLTDPKIRFDPITGHWYVIAISLGKSSGAWRLAVSRSSDPTDGFFLYSLIITGIGPDFDAIGFNDDKVVLTANAFDCVPNCVSGSTFLGAMFVVLKKDDLLAGSSTPNFEFFPPDSALNTIQPAHSLSSTSTLYMTEVASGSATSIRIWSLTGVPDETHGGVTSTTTDLTINPLSTPPGAEQKGTSVLIETNDNDLLDAVFRDDSLWVAANSSCTPTGDTDPRACLRFIQVLTGTMTVNKDFDFGTKEDYYYYPAIQTDSANNLIAVFSKSSAKPSAPEFASVYGSGMLTSETTLETPVLIKAGEAPYEPFADRWGDYSGAGIDPSDQASVWVAGEYARIEGGSEWGTWIAKIGLGASGFTLSAIKAGNGTGMVTISTPATTCDSTCAATSLSYSTSTSISLTAAADLTALFIGWRGYPDCTSSQATINFTINANTTCVATFVIAPDLTGQIVSLTRKTRHGMDKLKFTLAIKNIGTAPVTGSFVAQFFLSGDNQLDAGDTLLLQTTVNGRKLTPGKTISVKGAATVSSASQGKYLIGFIDATNVITELSETNNTASQQIP